MHKTDEIDDDDWDELSLPLQAAAAKLGYDQQLWDSDREPTLSERNWSELSSQQQKAASLLGYTAISWDNEECSIESISIPDVSRSTDENGHVDDWVDSPEHTLENRINMLNDEILHRQKKLKRILGHGKKEGTAYAGMLKRHEDCVNSHLLQTLKDSHPDSSHQNETSRSLPFLKQSPLRLMGDTFVNEYYHTLPNCLAIALHCILYSTLTELASKLLLMLSNVVNSYYTGWHIIDNNFDDSLEEHLFFFVAIIFAFSLLRITGALYEWDEHRVFQRKTHFHFRNRWHLRCWDMRVMNWFSGGVLREMFDEKTISMPVQPSEAKWGPRLKCILNIFCFFLLFGCADHLVEEAGSRMILNQKEMILEGLPSRQLHQEWSKNATDGYRENYCIDSGSGDTEEDTSATGPGKTGIADQFCLVDLEMDFISDVWNWVKNANRCGWVLDEKEHDEDGSNDDDDDEDGSDDDDDYECDDDCPEKQASESGILSLSRDRAPKKFKPWKQSDEEWIRNLNVRDDEYLRASISMESYFSLIGDPDAHFINPVSEVLYYGAITGISFGWLYWCEIPFQLM